MAEQTNALPEMSPSDALTILAESGEDMLSIHDAEGNYLFASPSTRRVTGWRPHELHGRNAYEFFHPEDIAAIEGAHMANLASDQGYRVRYRILGQDKQYRWVSTTARGVDTGSDLLLCFTRRCTDDEPKQAIMIASPPPVERV